MTNEEIFEIAMRQSAYDLNCDPQDFLQRTHVIVDCHIGEKARRYYKEPVACNLVSYGNNIVASVKPEYRDIVSEYIHKFEFYHCFETPNMYWLNRRLQKQEQTICFMAEYFLPDMTKIKRLDCGYEMKVLQQDDFAGLYLSKWSNALCEKRKELDVLGIGAYEDGSLIGLAGCSADCEEMWQIGIDILPEYRKQGVAAALVSNLSMEILERGKVPFYCSAWSNIRSVKTALKSGLTPAWVEMTAKPVKIVEEMNGQGEE